jgi:hypothetical protein
VLLPHLSIKSIVVSEVLQWEHGAMHFATPTTSPQPSLLAKAQGWRWSGRWWGCGRALNWPPNSPNRDVLVRMFSGVRFLWFCS